MFFKTFSFRDMLGVREPIEVCSGGFKIWEHFAWVSFVQSPFLGAIGGSMLLLVIATFAFIPYRKVDFAKICSVENIEAWTKSAEFSLLSWLWPMFVESGFSGSSFMLKKGEIWLELLIDFSLLLIENRSSYLGYYKFCFSRDASLNRKNDLFTFY